MNKLRTKKWVSGSMALVTLLSLPALTRAQKSSIGVSSLQQGFTTPPDSVKPSVYWYWMSDNLSKEGVVKDLEAMSKVGIGRAFIGNIGYDSIEVPYGKVPLFSDEWWAATKAALTTATKKGIDIGIFNGPGWSQSGGPWIKPAQSMRYLAGEEVHIKGPQQYNQKLPEAGKDFQDVAVLAFPVPAAEGDDISKHSPVVSSNVTLGNAQQLVDGNLTTETFISSAVTNGTLGNAQQLVDGNLTTETFISSAVTNGTVADIDITLPADFTARSLVLYPAKKPFRADVLLQVNDSGSYRTIKSFELDRSNPAANVGFIPFAPIAVSFTEAVGKQFRLVLSNISGTPGFAEIKLSAAPAVERFEEKQLAKMFQTPLPLWPEYQWKAQAEPSDKATMIDPAKVIEITKNLSADGSLNWSVPAGEWIVVRYGMLPTGVPNSPASVQGRGLEIDKINKAALQLHFDSFVGKIQSSLAPADAKSLKWVVADSYETGSQNWTDGMADAFKQQYGYNPLPWLPVMNGRVVGTQDQSDRFLWDLRRLVADRVAYQYVAGLRDVSHEHGLKLWLENYGHWGFPSEFLKYGGQSDEVAGEFWNEGTLGNIECKAASSSAHIYGKTKVAAESFTAGGEAFVRYPGLLKKRGDWSFTEGINNTLLHVFIEQPYEDRNPGVNAGFGTEFNRKNTWFYQGKAFIDYERRCNYLLQQGKPVNDVAYFIGEDAPKMTGVRNPELPTGYGYDYINAEVLEQRVGVKDGRLVLPDGMSYRLLVLPQLETMRPELLEKIKELVAAGATILGPAPKRSPSMQNFPAADDNVKKLAAEIWGNVDGQQVKKGSYGKGTVLNGMTMQEAFALLKLVPDISLTDKNVLYAHRTTKDGELYFITNQTNQTINISPAFRVAGKQPEWWDAVTGDTRALPAFTQAGETTTVPLQLEAYQSGFMVFNKTVAATASVKNNFPEASLITEIKTPWKVSFDTAKRGPAKPVIFTRLIDWSTSEDEQIKNYSGTAFYSASFNVDKLPKGEKIYLNTGVVKVMAKIKLNGIDVGSVWTAPFKVEVSKAIKPGINKVEIEVVNTWVNRLIGDSKLPAEQRKTWSNVNPYNPNSTYEPSGLLGPVKVESVKY